MQSTEHYTAFWRRTNMGAAGRYRAIIINNEREARAIADSNKIPIYPKESAMKMHIIGHKAVALKVLKVGVYFYLSQPLDLDNAKLYFLDKKEDSIMRCYRITEYSVDACNMDAWILVHPCSLSSIAVNQVYHQG